MKNILAFILLAFWGVISAYGQEVRSIKIVKTDEHLRLDGILDEDTWKNAEVAKDFYQNFPFDTARAVSKTEVRITYNEQYIYIGAVCYDDIEKQYVIQSLKRDFTLDLSDYFQVSLDPFTDKTNGFNFAVNPYGVQSEGLISDGGNWGGSTLDWDNKWYSHVQKGDGYWSVEMAIPFKTIRFKDNLSKWGINFARSDLKRNERSTWGRIPRNFSVTSLAFVGDLIWDNPPKKTGANVSLIPYASSAASRDFRADTVWRLKPNTGIDAKVAVTSSLNLDVTVNPDFSQVEVDRQVTNLSRFSLFFPERRQFFIENNDLFARFGFSQIRPFFSRQIGLAYNQSNFLYTQVPILAGARLSGKLDENWRIGALTMQTKAMPSMGLETQNYSTFAVQRKVFSRSNIGAIFVNKQGFEKGKSISLDTGYNRVLGVDYNIASKNNRWGGKVFWHQSFSPLHKNISVSQAANASWLSYSTRKLFAMWNHEYVGENYNAEVGFVPRKGYWRLEPMFSYIFYPKRSSSILNNHSPELYSDMYFDLNRKLLDRIIKGSYVFNFTSSAFIKFQYNENYIYLFSEFDPTNTLGVRLPDSTSYKFRSASVAFQSNIRRKFSFQTSTEWGTYYNGHILTNTGIINFRKQPWGIFSMAYSFNRIMLPNPYNSADLLVVGPRIDISVTKNVFFTGFFQYNSQISNFNINARLQWRFRPVSDLFLVYTDNYFATPYGNNIYSPNPIIFPRNRAIVLKLNYWINA